MFCVYILKYFCLIFNVLLSPIALIFGCTELRISSVVCLLLFFLLWTDNMWLNVFFSPFANSLKVASLPVFHCFGTLLAPFYSLGCSSHYNYGLISRPSPAKSEQNQQFSKVMLFRKDKCITVDPPCFFFAFTIGHLIYYKKISIVKVCFTCPVIFL